ncbi:hypothetical protein P153DRAFT_412352 [Dothidotthia symphoricarpi CBS 119687]|uniref:Aminoglycoside phosphotransferase domain-containing protein n=1 Tax=Dothidotthia symphoricarpi CBS 119687 TaxID=1392245 RepID=A0A6A5ZXR5_9PLEO|nr:uncharacterized protein P153DRAFT_412352 [Dothidotthia symphoricarpi CBS 119687]KAF2124066.1 hypothetical protein P153DRAFT_412352 [Dothidotthia symphoricarpi CBS 119687]
MARPILRKQREDGSARIIEEDTTEEELYRYTRYRWSCNEPENLAMRYRKFNISALLDAAVHAVGNGAKSCVKVVKCVEGQYNKAFTIIMDNGAEVFAKIPNPNAGPAFYTTASEVATRDFLCDLPLLRTILKLPVPPIYTYCSDPFNPVGAEYIIEEKAKGKPLGSLWYMWQKETQLGLVTRLVDFETKLTSVSFGGHGCIYYKKDLEKKAIQVYDLDARSYSSGDLVKGSPAEEFVVGPLTEARLWEGDRAMMKLDRGPWITPISYLTALGVNELQWAKTHAKPRTNPYQSLEALETPGEYISLLERYLQLVPHLSPGPSRTSLSHPDLHLDNIFVDPDTKQITCIIDWQSVSVSGLFFQHKIPRLLLPIRSYTTRNCLKTASDGSKATHDADGTSDLLRHYQHLTRLKNEQQWVAVTSPNRSLRIKPNSLLCGAWSRNDVFSFRHALINIVAHWEEITPVNAPCPIQFDPKELELHNDELEVVEGLGEVLHQLQDDNLIPLGGMVLPENYEQALHINNTVKEMFVNMAESESQRVLFSRIWPYQDQSL